MKYNDARFRLTGQSPILGSIPLDPDIYREYFLAKTKTEGELQRATEDMEDVRPQEEATENKATGFYRDAEGNVILKEYQIKGFLKEAARTLKNQIQIASPLSKVDNYVFILEPNIIVRDKNGNSVTKVDGILDRPLRALTAQGPRVALAYSEMINDWSIEFTVRVIDNEKTPKSQPITLDTIEELFSYGAMKGLLQWRNGGYGKFTFERVSEDDTTK